MRKSLTKLAEKGGADPDEVLARVEPVDEIVPADLLIEAVVEDFAVKEEIFRARRCGAAGGGDPRVEHVVDPDHVARRGRRRAPDRVIGMHFFNPVPVLKLVEVIRGLDTSDETAQRDHRARGAISARRRPRRATCPASSRTGS